MTSHKKTIPKTGLSGLKTNWKADLLSGFLVFLIALPLCLGISMASGFPPVAGIFTAIIGGIIVSFFGGSQLTIKGPAAGLIVIALGAVEELGRGNALQGYQLALAVVVAAGILQVIFGLLKSGILSDFFPSAAVHGMLAAIGIIIAAKQLHTLVGVKPAGKETIDLLLELPRSFRQMNPEIAIIGGVSLLILFLFPLIKNKYVKLVPAPLLVILVSIPLGMYFDLEHEHKYLFLDHHTYTVGPRFLVTLPDNLLSAITFPDFSQLFTATSLKYVVMFALVGSLESLLSSKAIDTLDPWKRKSNMNRDLIGVGVGNTLAGFIGGLPMISEIVRSSANINNGGRTWWSNVFHGLFLLIFVAFFPMLIHHIPLTALAAMLIFTGYRLAAPREFYKTYKIGREQLLIFVITVVTTLATDLLIGIGVGIVAKLLMHFANGLPARYMFKPLFTVTHVEETDEYTVDVFHSAVFSNFIKLKKSLDSLPRQRHIIIDFSNTNLVDHTVMENLHHYQHDYEHEDGKFSIIGLEKHRKLSGHHLSVHKNSPKSKMFNSFLGTLCLILFSVAAAAAQPSNRQQASQTHGWYLYTGNHALSEHWSLHTEYQWRRSGLIENWQQSLLRLGIDYHFRPDLIFTAGYGWIVTFPYGEQPIANETAENRLWQQVFLKQNAGIVRIGHRFRNEARWTATYLPLPDGDFTRNGFAYSNRFRYRLGLDVPLNRKDIEAGTLFMALSEELFLNYGAGTSLNRLDQNRLIAALAYQFSAQGNIQLGYLRQLVVKRDAVFEELNHTLFFSVTYNMNFRRPD